MGTFENIFFNKIPSDNATIGKLLISENHTPANSYKLSIPFAQDSNGNIESLVLGLDRDYEDVNLLVSGTIASGKTSLLQTIIASAAINYKSDELHVWVDSKSPDEYGSICEQFDSVTIITGKKQPDDNASSIPELLSKEIDRRFHILQALHEHILGYWEHMREKNYEILPRILFVADEPNGLYRNYYDCFAGWEKICRFGRGVGINCVLAIQRPDILKERLREYFQIRLALCSPPDWFRLVLENDYKRTSQTLDVISEAAKTSQTLSSGIFYLTSNGGEYNYLKRLTAIKL